ncbi:Free methionine-R-sulfoxide reductase [Colletotrichum siamense]|uniref:Free methionine-R-sulfoxide reductase n=1 Tax=Colletotrichum siamense TaxID=690259 RepID=A0A9P5ENE5_COLSI|nr:Free methionine-R-sulfoxide reductase [Colletotrichum siamense]KAF4855455.1 Free methionine-R-sulfoxide reductase [Colletotrichum siamense]
MVHADASNFANGVTKEEAYEQVLLQAEGLFYEQRNWVRLVRQASQNLTMNDDQQHHSTPNYQLTQLTQKHSNLSNTASLLWHAYHSLPAPSTSVNWAGFYVLDPKAPASKPALILGPFQGKVACQTIPFGRGVCGAAAATLQTQLVPDVDAFPGHIACDGDSKSEIVVPVVVDGKLVAIIDVDCALADGFDEVDRVWLEKLAALLAASSDW